MKANKEAQRRGKMIKRYLYYSVYVMNVLSVIGMVTLVVMNG